ncbi:MAG: tRNA uridine-5-carboxymethylaminomethyl(34) synthesis GTPase MnmE [Flavobacteriaceae bacterium]|nr:tRNA uridine-5-carboxymethylaminomethyl(34) synthesis GTPase MnmE [Flavobacteriaceae bacterium]NVJ72557.1 tRNA uridine-5-carboxymethylaminomethyl(34) synthesis GTPase MnmE [Flavobacteriaceae bacterium]
MHNNDTIIALATAPGTGAIAVIRLSGPNAIDMVSDSFESVSTKVLKDQKSHTVHLGHIKDGDHLIDQALVSIFKGPNSYTGENVAEISCHGSTYIQQRIMQLFLKKGVRAAQGGEFTMRAFLNAKMDLSQAEAVGDLIASENEASHQLALQQMRGGFSSEIKKLREQLLNFASLIELELDFAEEDVSFADRVEFKKLLNTITEVLKKLIDSFALGNVLKNGVPVAIVGAPNVGKSTLLNALLNEERAIVSNIAGTTRDTIEDELSIGGIGFRFIDTAGIRATEDQIEKIGIQKTFEKIGQAKLILYLIDSLACVKDDQLAKQDEIEILKIEKEHPKKHLIVLGNKVDQLSREEQTHLKELIPQIQFIAAKTGEGVEKLKESFIQGVHSGAISNNDTIITNSRHYDSLIKALEEIDKVKEGLSEELPSDLLAIDIRQALYHFGEITGEISSDELLGNIFANFCIGK